MAALLPGKKLGTFWRGEKYLSPNSIRAPDGPAPSLVAIQTTPVQLPT